MIVPHRSIFHFTCNQPATPPSARTFRKAGLTNFVRDPGAVFLCGAVWIKTLRKDP